MCIVSGRNDVRGNISSDGHCVTGSITKCGIAIDSQVGSNGGTLVHLQCVNGCCTIKEQVFELKATSTQVNVIVSDRYNYTILKTYLLSCATRYIYKNTNPIVGVIDYNFVNRSCNTGVTNQSNDRTFSSSTVMLMSSGVYKCSQYLIKFIITVCCGNNITVSVR